MHPLYNTTAKVKEGVLEFYDYDVALVQLEADVQISATTRWELVSYKHCCSCLDFTFLQILSLKICYICNN